MAVGWVDVYTLPYSSAVFTGAAYSAAGGSAAPVLVGGEKLGFGTVELAEPPRCVCRLAVVGIVAIECSKFLYRISLI